MVVAVGDAVHGESHSLLWLVDAVSRESKSTLCQESSSNPTWMNDFIRSHLLNTLKMNRFGVKGRLTGELLQCIKVKS